MIHVQAAIASRVDVERPVVATQIVLVKASVDRGVKLNHLFASACHRVIRDLVPYAQAWKDAS